MADCPLSKIEFDLFWKVSSVVLAPNILNLIKDLPSRFEEYKQKIRQSTGRDADSGIPFLPPERTRKFLEFDLSKRLMWLIRCLYASAFAVLVYGLFGNVPQPLDSPWYDCLVAASTILGLLPTFLSIWIGISILAQLVSLYRESSKTKN